MNMRKHRRARNRRIAGSRAGRRSLPAGIRFARYVTAMAKANGNARLAYKFAKRRYADTPEVAKALKRFGAT